MTDDEVRDELIDVDEWALWESGKHRAILRKLAEERRARSEADREATKLANSDLATTEKVIRALRAENERLRKACGLALTIMEQKNKVSVPPYARTVTLEFDPGDVAVLRAALEKKP